MPSSCSWARTERTVCLMAAWAQCSFYFFSRSGMYACVWNILSVLQGLGVFSKLFWSRESIVHVWVTCQISLRLCCAVQGLPCTRVSASFLLYRYKFKLCCHWSAEFQLNPVGWQLFPGSRLLSYCQHVTLFTLSLKFHVLLEDVNLFPQMSLFPYHILKLIFYQLTVELNRNN